MNTFTINALRQQAGPITWQMVFWMFIAFMRKLGLLPPPANPDEDKYTSLGQTGAYAKALQDSNAHIASQHAGDQNTIMALQTRAQQITYEYSTGTATVTA